MGGEAGSKYSYDSFIIEKIEIEGEPHLIAKGWLVPLQNARKVKAKKQVLFTTEDGVEIFGGEEVWYVSLVSDYTLNKTKAREAITPIPSYFRYFSTEARVKDFIIMNKPMLSVKDVLALDVNIDLKMSKAEANRAGMDDGDDCCVIRNKDLIQLAKDKMNKK